MGSLIFDHLFHGINDNDKVAFSYRPKLRTKRWKYSDLSRASFQFARELERREIGHGDRVIIWSENSPKWVAAFYGIVLRGAIAVPLDEQSSPDFVHRVCDKTSPKLMLYGRHVTCETAGVPSISLSTIFHTLASASPERYKSSGITPDNPVEIVFTSGTTSEPKGVVLTHENLMANLAPMEREINKYVKWKFFVEPIRILCLLPLSHVFGQMMGIFIPQLLNAETIFQDRLNPSDVISTIKREHVMVTAAVPRILETLENKIERDYESRSSVTDFHDSLDMERSWLAAWWKYRRVHGKFGWKFVSFVTGGATLNERTEIFWRRLGYAVVQGYGMTETAALVSLNNPFTARRGSLGQVLAGRENVRINENGEILVRGKNISPGYWGETRSDSQDEWLNTGDVGSMDETGRLYFKGRKKDVIVTAAGLNIYPEDLENAVNAQPETIASAVVGIEGANGPEPAAAMILRSGANAADVIKRANTSLLPYQQIRQWIEWPDADLPRTATQKVRKNIIADAFAESQTGGESKERRSTLDAIFARLGHEFNKSLYRDSRLNGDLNMDSLSRVELISAIEDQYQIDIDESSFTESTTVGEIEKMLMGRPVKRDDIPRFPYPRWPLRSAVRWLRTILYELVIYPITLSLCWVKVIGKENLLEINGPVLFVSNHVTYVDPALIMSAMPRRFRSRLAIAMDGERLRSYLNPPVSTGFIKRVRWFFTYWLVITFFNAFPLPRLGGFRRSFDFAGEAMDRGYNVLIFPEGELTKDGCLQPFKPGIGMLANGLEAPVVPVSIRGLYQWKAAGRRGFAKPGSVTIKFGKPLIFDDDMSVEKITRELEAAAKELQND